MSSWQQRRRLRLLTSCCQCVLQALALCLLGFATLDHNPGAEVLEAIQQKVVASAQHFDTQAIANCLWALALLRALPASTWNALLSAFCKTVDPEKITPGKRQMLFVCQAWPPSTDLQL